MCLRVLCVSNRVVFASACGACFDPSFCCFEFVHRLWVVVVVVGRGPCKLKVVILQVPHNLKLHWFSSRATNYSMNYHCIFA